MAVAAGVAAEGADLLAESGGIAAFGNCQQFRTFVLQGSVQDTCKK
jgi:hypothetical protein